ncbi:MAG: hypothetical protein KGK07_01615, partial [Chloroflexota bacterium]|nr:hypothetical protein [Chloroflexota bacterium]
LGSLNPGTSINFTMSITVPGSTVSSNTVTVWADGLENNVPTTPISSVSTAVSAGASRLAFTTQPSATGTTGGIAFASQPVVTLYDVNNNVLTGSTASVTLTLSGGTAGAVLTCAQAGNTVTAFNGTATFSGCKINLAGTGYVLTASSLGATGAVSNAITITVGPAAQVGFTTQPVGAAAGAALATQPIVQVQDAGSNAVSSSGIAITLSVSPGSTASGLTCTTNPVNTNASGAAGFAGCTLTGAGTASLLAQATGLYPATSTSFTITPAGATKLAFKTPPSATATAGAPFAVQPVVVVQDAYGNTVTTSSASVTLAIAVGTGTLTCSQASNTTAAVSGVATFSGCSLTPAGTYQLNATSTGLTNAPNTADIVVS